MPYEIFISYAHEDRPYLNKLIAHLSILRKQKLITTWVDTDISPGAEWRQHIMDHLDRAQIILLLISADFMNSDFCYSTEMALAIQRHKAKLACVIPIILRPVYWEGAPFAELKILPTDAKPITRWSTHDDAFEDVVQGIAFSIKELQKKGKAPNP